MSACTPAPTPKPKVLREFPGPRTLTLIATADLHGHVETLPLLGGYLRLLRKKGAFDSGVLLLDAGDYLQGTLDSNLEEGKVVVSAYRALGYDAVALGNHEFDFGPVGDVSAEMSADPFGALKARIEEAKHPVLSTNLLEVSSGERPKWRGLGSDVMVDVPGFRVGIIGALTEETPKIVMPAYFHGLDVAPVAPRMAERAKALRDAGARVVIALAHLGGECTDFANPDDTSSCKPDSEVEKLARALPPGSVDVILAGHTHQAMAHRINGVAIAQAWAYGRGFARVDVVVPVVGPVETRLFPPQELCATNAERAPCAAAKYEGALPEPDAKVAAITEAAQRNAAERRATPVGVVLDAPVVRAFDRPSDLGNLFADLLLEHEPTARLSIMNGGGLRADLPAGALSYGALYEAMPFDNRVAKVQLTAAEVAQVVQRHLTTGAHGTISIAGLSASAQCKNGALEVALRDAKGRLLAANESILVVTSDYLATGGDGLFEGSDLTGRVEIASETLLRDAFAKSLAARGKLAAVDPKRFSADHPRIAFPGPRPVNCTP
ncbi:MAG: bifunctional UDP-sugar hydrolase/5'-nucleotidase [Polyangiaceae bacterium]